MKKHVGIIGYSATKIGKHADKTPLDLAWEALRDALKHSGIKKTDIDGLYISPEGFGAPNAQMFASRVTEFFGKPFKSCCKYELGGTTSLLALKHAVQEIMLGRIECAAVLAAEKNMTEGTPEDFHTFIASSILGLVGLYGTYQAPYGIGAPVPFYAMGVQRYMHEYGVTPEQIAKLAVILRDHASQNPLAEFQKPITVEEVLASRMISPPMHLLECSKFSDGAACVILCSEKKARELKKELVFITGMGEYHDDSHFIPTTLDKSICEFIAVKEAAKEAFADAGKKPEDIHVAEVYGVFAGTELMVIEDLGFFSKGEAALAAQKDWLRVGGQLPVDTSGGRLSHGHPACVTPLLEVIEISKQLRGEANGRQVKNAKTGLVHAEHGMLNGSMVMILET